jgi:hypothetical protein
MPKLKGIIRSLGAQRAAAQAQIEKLDRAIEALSEVGRRRPGRKAALPGKPKRHMSAAARKRIAKAQRARWAKFRRQRQKRNISPEGRRRISEAISARWAASRKAHGDSTAPLRLLSSAAVAALPARARRVKAKAAKPPGA